MDRVVVIVRVKATEFLKIVEREEVNLAVKQDIVSTQLLSMPGT